MRHQRRDGFTVLMGNVNTMAGLHSQDIPAMDGAENRRRISTKDEQRRRAMLRALGYAGFGSDKLDDWRTFGTGLLGFQAVERGNSLLAFRMDDRKQRVVIDRAMGDGARFFGWEVADGAALDALAARLESAGTAVTAEPQTLADARR